ncbi:MAG: rod shape-determining protein MreC [Candidatus Doudnabacteria bacterium]
MRSSKQLGVFSLLIFLGLVLLVLSINGLSKPLESTGVQPSRPLVYIFSGVGNSFKSFFSYFSSVNSVNKKNAELSEQARKLLQENVSLQQYKLENEKLRDELEYRQRTAHNLVSATVLGKDPSGFSQSLVLNIGSGSGIKVGAAVLSQGYLIGKIVSVDSFTSKVLLVTDPQSTIDAQISATGDNGIVRGSYGSGMIIENLSQSALVNTNDRVITAGLSTEIPKGLLIGNVGQLQSQKSDLLQKATVISGVDLKNLEFVSVIKE